MNITPSTIYWITRLNDISSLLSVVLAIESSLILIYIVNKLLDSEDTDRIRKIAMPHAPIVAALSMLAITFLPSSRDAAVMYVIPAIANNEKVQMVGNRLYDLAIEWMDELKPAKKEEN